MKAWKGLPTLFTLIFFVSTNLYAAGPSLITISEDITENSYLLTAASDHYNQLTELYV